MLESHLKSFSRSKNILWLEDACCRIIAVAVEASWSGILEKKSVRKADDVWLYLSFAPLHYYNTTRRDDKPGYLTVKID